METVKTQNDDVLDYAGLAAHMKMSAGTLRHWVSKGRLPCIKVGYHVLFSRKQIDLWLLEHARAGRVIKSKPKRKKDEGGGGMLPFGEVEKQHEGY